MKKFCFLILCAGFLFWDLAGAVRVTRAKISLGSSFRLPAGSLANFEFLVENPSPVPCRVMIRLRQAEAYLPGGNNNSPEVFVPGKSSVVYTLPVHLESAEKYNYEIFVNGIKQKSSVLQNCLVRLTGFQDFCIGLLNDSSDLTDGLYFKNAKSRSSIYNIRSSDAPRRKELYDHLRLLVIAKPDFSGMSAEQYSAILEYVYSGGTVVFADPEGALQAAATPLKAILPLEITGIHRIHDPEAFSFFSGVKVKELPRDGVAFLCGVPGSERQITSILTLQGFPVLSQMRCGLGSSKLLAFAMSNKNFINSPHFLEMVRRELFFVPDTEKVCSDFASALNMLTGFAVPDSSLIRNILLIYFLALGLILFWGFRKKRTSTAWILCVCCALCGTLLILLYARMTIGKRNSLAAVIHLENALIPESPEETYTALYSRRALRTRITASGTERNILSVIPFPRTLGILRAKSDTQVLDLHSTLRGGMEVRSLDLPVRTARQFLQRKAAGTLPLQDAMPSPVLLLDRNGMRLLPWKLPFPENVENIFMIFPGGSRLVKTDSEGICTLADGREYMTDPLLRELRTALEKSYSKKYPVLLTVSPAGKKDAAKHPLEKEFILQGKVLRMYPADIRVDENADLLHIPGELLMLSRSDQTGRMLLSGNRLQHGYEFQDGQDITLKLTLPVELQKLRIRSATLDLTLSNPAGVQIRTVLKSDSAQTFTCKNVQGNRYIFTPAKEIPAGNSTHNYLLTIQGSSTLKRRSSSVDVKVARWGILSLNLSLQGTLPDPAGNAGRAVIRK